jgi:hypothetical protein
VLWQLWALLIGTGLLISAGSFYAAWKLTQASRPTHMLIIRGPGGTDGASTSGEAEDAVILYRGQMLEASAALSWADLTSRLSDTGYLAILYGPAGVDSLFGLRTITQASSDTFT